MTDERTAEDKARDLLGRMGLLPIHLPGYEPRERDGSPVPQRMPDVSALATIIDILRTVQWSGHIHGFPACPECYGTDPHAADCRLAALIGARVKA